MEGVASSANPPNPNKGLNQFVKSDPSTGSPSFDAVSWRMRRSRASSWDAVSWADVSWSDVSWADVSWSDVSWADVSWADVLAVADVSWEDNANDETAPAEGEYTLSPEELEAARLADPELFPAADPVVEAVELVVEAAPAAVQAAVAPVAQTLSALTTP